MAQTLVSVTKLGGMVRWLVTNRLPENLARKLIAYLSFGRLNTLTHARIIETSGRAASGVSLARSAGDTPTL